VAHIDDHPKCRSLAIAAVAGVLRCRVLGAHRLPQRHSPAGRFKILGISVGARVPPVSAINAFSGVRFLLSSNISHLLMVLLSATPPHAQLSKI
jgi:hypothetical protein